jgi:hypothetical protein
MKNEPNLGRTSRTTSPNNGVDLWHRETMMPTTTWVHGRPVSRTPKKCYMNGYKEGQTRRVFEKQRHAG